MSRYNDSTTLPVTSVYNDSTPLLQHKSHIHPWSSTDHLYNTHSTASSPPTSKSLWQRITSANTYSDATHSNNLTLGVYLLSAIFVAVANNITWKATLDRFKSTDNTHNLEAFANQFSVALYVPMAAVVLAQRMYAGHITQAQRMFPTRKFAAMGLLDAAAGVCSAIGCSFTSGSVQTLCNQAAIPSTMMMSRIFLQQQYSRYQYIGATLIVLGALSAALPAGMNGQDADGTTLLGLMVLSLSIVPSSFSNVYKESNFKTEGLDVYYLTVYVSVFQVLLGFVFLPILGLPGLGGLSLLELPSNFADGWNCFLGRYVENYECHLDDPPYIPMLAYVVVNFAYNTLLLLITKHGSALLLVISSALSLPLTNLLFTQSLFMGKHAESFSIYNLVGLVIVVVGFLMYSLSPGTNDSSEFMPVAGAGGQMLYITDDSNRLPYMHRRRSFDIATTPSYSALKDNFAQQLASKRDGQSDNGVVHGSLGHKTTPNTIVL